jgi:hypothetical protein
MNVDKIRKMNVLTNTLKEHGLAATREDAVCLAGEMVGAKEDEDVTRILDESDQNIEINNDPDQTSLNGNLDTNHSKVEKKGFSEEQIKNILQSFTDQFCAEIKGLNEKIQCQEEMYNKLQEKFNGLSNQNVVTQEQPKEEQTIVEQPEQVAPQEQVQNEPVQTEVTQTTCNTSKPPQSSGRCGEYNSNDVSIDKFFYYGQK